MNAIASARPRHTLLLLLRLVIAAGVPPTLMSGCGDDNPVKPNPTQKYLDSSTPQNVLFNLKQAYTSRDSAGYDSLFDAAYIGTSIEASVPGSLSFTKSDEAAHIGALMRSATITAIELDFGPTSRYTDTADTLVWASVYLGGPLFRIHDDKNSYFLDPDVTMDFKFRPTTPSPGSPTDTTWRIVRWTENNP